MKKMKYVVLALSTILFASCYESGGSSYNSYDFPGNSYYYTLPDDCEEVCFSDSQNGKKCFLIYSNETGRNLYNSDITIEYNKAIEAANRSAVDEKDITITKNVWNFGNGVYRDEVHFKVPNIDIKKSARSARAVSGSYNSKLNNNLKVGDTLNFSGYINNNKNYISQSFTLKAVGEHCRIWFLNNNSSVVKSTNFTTNVFNSLKEQIDTVFTQETAIFGSNIIQGGEYAITTDSNTKLDVLVYDLFGDAKEDQTSGTFGFFNPLDMYLNGVEYQEENGSIGIISGSNECEVIHIDSNFLQNDIKKNTANVESTLVHEFQHLLNFCNKYGQYETWFTEMLSMCSEDIFQCKLGTADSDSPKSRFSVSFDSPYQGFGIWADDATDPDKYPNVYNSYANAYAFGAYLMRNFGGIKLIHEIATNNYRDSSAITQALRSCGYDETFYTVLQKFGMVYIFTNNKGLSLNKSFTENFKNVSYSITGANLSNYPFHKYNSLSALKNDMNNNLYYESTKYFTDSSNPSICYSAGPRIFQTSYKLSNAIQPYGFTVYYVGKVDSDESIYIERESEDLTMTLVLKD